jgi:hypothetical protein
MRFLRFLRSMKLAVLLLGFLALISLPSTLFPQGEQPDYYYETFGSGSADFIMALGLNDVFSSPLFYFAAAMFFLNLSYCTLWRVVRELRKKGRGRHGPDILHIGLIIFLIGAVFSAILGKETPIIWMEPGDTITLPQGGRFTLISFDAEYYDDGRPRAWISSGMYVDVGGIEKEIEIVVNSPARLEGVKIYQNSYRVEPTLLLAPRPGSGAPDSLDKGDRYADLAFHSLQQDETGGWQALFADSSGLPVFIGEGEMIGDAFVGSYEIREITGLRMARDPGVTLVFISFLPIAAGLALILFEKRKNL